MATKVKPSRLNITGTPQAGNVPVYVDEDNFQWGAGGGGGGSTYTAGHGINIDSNDEISNTLPFEPTNTGTAGQVLKLDSNGDYGWDNESGGGGGDVSVSTDTGNELTTGAKLWIGLESDFSSITTPDSNTMYIQYVTDGGGGWQPGVNTRAYYPLDADFNDASGNNRNLTNSGATITTLSGINCAYFDGSSYSQLDGYSLGNSHRTINVWVKCTGGGYQGIVHIAPYSGDSGGSLGIKFNNGNINVGPGDWANASAESVTANVSAGNWHNIVVTQETSTTKLYIDGTLIGTISDYPSQSQTPGGWALGSKYYSDHSEKLTGYLSKVILEDKVWTATEIADYYNQTKADYGIS